MAIKQNVSRNSEAKSKGWTNWTLALLPEERKKLDAIVDELSSRIGIRQSRAQVVRRAIDELYTVVCPTEGTEQAQ